MPSWISKGGIWSPAKERVYDEKKDEIYEGPDRAASEILTDENVEHLGIKSSDDPQIIEIAQRMGLSVEEYQKRFAPSQKQMDDQKKNQENVIDHKAPAKKKGVKPRGGGVTISGGFGEPNEKSSSDNQFTVSFSSKRVQCRCQTYANTRKKTNQDRL